MPTNVNSDLHDSSSVFDKDEEFLEYLRRTAYELRSVKATLSLFAETSSNLDDQQQATIKDLVTVVGYASEGLLSKSMVGQKTHHKNRQYTLVYLSASEVIDGKKAEYRQIKFNLSGINNSQFDFIKINPEDLNFLISSIIDRSVKASGNKGEILLLVYSNQNYVWVTVTDHGEKISQEEVDNTDLAFDNDSFFSRIHEILRQNNGKVSISSSDKETSVTLGFPIVQSPSWMVDNITLNYGDIVVVLSDDTSVHNEWDTCFKEEKRISLEHVTSVEKAVAFINSKNKESVFFIADFDLVNKESNALQVLLKTMIPWQTVFMVSNHSDQSVLEFANKIGVWVLPKQLISKITYRIVDTKREVVAPVKIDLVVIDNDKSFADNLTRHLRKKHPSAAIQTYYDPHEFLKVLPRYPKDVKIVIDNDLGANITGLEISKQLSAADYKNIYLVTGSNFAQGEVPDYITLVPKGSMDSKGTLDKLP